MNEVMVALEAMIRRIVKEEMNDPSLDKLAEFATSLKGFVDTCGPEWAAVVSQGALDKPWFDNAVKAEIASSNEDSAFSFATKDAFDQYVKAMVEPITGGTADYGVPFKRAVSDFVRNDETIHDFIVSIAEDYSEDAIGHKVDSYMDRNIDIGDIVRTEVRDMSFSVTVD